MSQSSAEQDEFFDSLLSDFLDESSQLLDRLNENLLRLDEYVSQLDCPQDQPCDLDLINEMFRAAHSIKGLSAMLGLRDINHLTHKIENLFDAVRHDQIRLNGQSVELLFHSYDCLLGLIDRLRDNTLEPPSSEPVVERIQLLLAAAGADKQQTTQADAERALVQPESLLATESALSDIAPQEVVVPPMTAASSEPADEFASIVDETQIPPKYLSIFLDETELSLDGLTELLLGQEAHNDAGVAENLLIIAHRIKGSAAAVGLQRPAKLAHHMEDVLQTLNETSIGLSPEVTDALLRCTDALRNYLSGLRVGAADSSAFQAAYRELLTAGQNTAQMAAIQPVAPPSAAATDEVPVDLAELVASLRAQILPDQSAVIGRIAFDQQFPLIVMKAQLICEKLSRAGQVIHCQPSPEELESREEIAYLTFGLITTRTYHDVESLLRIAGVRSVELTELASSHSSAETELAPVIFAPQAEELESRGSKKSVDADPAKPTETLRVDIERLDQLMNLAGQLVINKARFARIGDGLKHLTASRRTGHILENAMTLVDSICRITEPSSGADLAAQLTFIGREARRVQSDLGRVRADIDSFTSAGAIVGDLLESVHQLDRVSDGIQKTVMDTRMVAIGPLFGRFRRVVRDITRSNGKDIRLVILGEKTELDKRMIDELGDPLIHMVRNSADHGIESPEARVAAGKSPQGTITLNAFHRGNSIYIQITDDGRGLDQDRIRNKAIERGLLTPADAQRLTPHQVFALIWEPGLSTADRITEISGRGMGMDIVRAKIEELNGTVDLDSQPGAGTVFTIKLPLTLAILPSLMAEIDRDVFALPVESVVEIVQVKPQDLCTVHNQPAACVRGRVVSIIELGEALTWNVRPMRASRRPNEDCTLVIMGTPQRQVGLAVDRLLGEEDLVIKSMAENYRDVRGVAGASILGDGRVSLILDVGALLDLAAAPVAALNSEINL
jgi:two-component system chemotaxis sensor kinase CheA